MGAEDLEFHTSDGGNSFTMETFKFMERRNCGCTWLYLANQPVVAPCTEHLRLLEPEEEERPLIGTHCAVEGCGKPQFQTSSGESCSNGHGGAPALEDNDE